MSQTEFQMIVRMLRKIPIRRVGEILVSIAIVVTLMLLILPALWKAQDGGGLEHCRTNIRSVFADLYDYDRQHGSLPPAILGNGEGTIPYSWRVALLPYCQSSSAAAYKYDFSDTWDGPGNAELRKKSVTDFRCLTDPSALEQTSFLAPFGPNTPFAENSPASLSRLRQGTANTILIVESHNSGIHWMEPKDLSVDDVAKGINQPDSIIRSTHRGFFSSTNPVGAMTLFADGRALFLNSNTDPKILKSLAEGDNPDKPKEKSTPPQ